MIIFLNRDPPPKKKTRRRKKSLCFLAAALLKELGLPEDQFKLSVISGLVIV